MDFEKLRAPFDKIHWRAQTVVKGQGGLGYVAMALAYMDARDVMERLDAVCGPEGWQDSYHETPNGRIVCSLSLNVNGVWITKSDAAGDTAVEGEKGAVSDAFKRAAVKWGIGRYLYAMDAPWADCEGYTTNQNGREAHKFKKWTPSGLAKLNKIHAAYGVANDAPKEKIPFPKGIGKGIVELRELVRGLWKDVQDCTDYDQLVALTTTGDGAAIIKQCKELHKAHIDIWLGDGQTHDGLNGLITRKLAKLEAAANQDSIPDFIHEQATVVGGAG